jgi:glycine cleavage system H lipoate-binding protein
VGSYIKKGESLGALECVKVVAELYTPFEGYVKEINHAVFYFYLGN